MSPLKREQVEIGGQLITVEPSRGAQFEAFRREVVREFSALVGRAERLALRGTERKPLEGIDQADLLKQAFPRVVTAALLEKSTAGERAQLLNSLLRMNALRTLVAFADTVVLVDATDLTRLKAVVQVLIKVTAVIE